MKTECTSIDCIWNDLKKNGLCIGVSPYTRSFSKDVVRMCWVKKKPSANVACDVSLEAQMTPREAIAVGVQLIRASIIGDHLLNSARVADKKRSGEVSKSEETSSEKTA